MREPTADDYDALRKLSARVFNWPAGDGLYQHDHDEELARYWYEADCNPPNPQRDRYQAQDICAPSTPAAPSRSNTLEDAREVIRLTRELRLRLGLESIRVPRPRRTRDHAYWEETARVVIDYIELQAGSRYTEALPNGFFEWLKRSPSEGKQYVQGDDMARAALVDWYLSVVR